MRFTLSAQFSAHLFSTPSLIDDTLKVELNILVRSIWCAQFGEHNLDYIFEIVIHFSTPIESTLVRQN